MDGRPPTCHEDCTPTKHRYWNDCYGAVAEIEDHCRFFGVKPSQITHGVVTCSGCGEGMTGHSDERCKFLQAIRGIAGG